MLDVILIILIVASLGFLVWLIYQKLPHLINIDVVNLPGFKVKKKKQDILKIRLQRDLRKFFVINKNWAWPNQNKIFDFFKENYHKLKDLEKDLRRRSHQQLISSLDKSQALDKLLITAKQLINNEEYEKAENSLLDALSVDQYNIEVYKLLSEIYRAKKEFEQAKDTLQYLLKLTHNEDAGVFASLAEISKERGNLKQDEDEYLKSISLTKDNHLNFLSLAEVYLELDDKQKSLETAKRALLLSPNNPKVLDFLINVSIIMRDKELAEQYLAKLKEVNPDNQNINKFAEELEELK